MNNIEKRLSYINGEFNLRNYTSINIANINLKQKYVLIFSDRCKLNYHREIILYRIKSIKDFGDIKANTLGGFVQSYNNLSHKGDCWIYNNAKVYDNALVSGNAKVLNLSQLYDNAIVKNNAIISGKSQVCGNSEILDNVSICDESKVYGDSKLCGSIKLINNFIANNLICDGNTVFGRICSICGLDNCSHLQLENEFGNYSRR
ncbi:MAG: hypothetical protein M0Q13_11230 [Methanothrix sp.]|jgi:NDP-sugar pyrophosphorylase family protein|nr:hypothetical protein [Methanothrix sp.]